MIMTTEEQMETDRKTYIEIETNRKTAIEKLAFGKAALEKKDYFKAWSYIYDADAAMRRIEVLSQGKDKK